MKVLSEEVFAIWGKIDELGDELRNNTTKKECNDIKALLEVANTALFAIMRIENEKK